MCTLSFCDNAYERKICFLCCCIKAETLDKVKDLGRYYNFVVGFLAHFFEIVTGCSIYEFYFDMSGFLAGGLTHGTYLDKYSVLMHKKKVSYMHTAISR